MIYDKCLSMKCSSRSHDYLCAWLRVNKRVQKCDGKQGDDGRLIKVSPASTFKKQHNRGTANQHDIMLCETEKIPSSSGHGKK